MKAKFVLVLVATASLAAGLMQPAYAAKPTRECSSPFQGPYTFAYLFKHYDLPAGYDLTSIDNNGDGLLCVKELDTKTPPALNISDNSSVK
jgi:hypothetical protein